MLEELEHDTEQWQRSKHFMVSQAKNVFFA